MIKSAQELISQDLASVWHPCSQMKDYENFKPMIVERAQGCSINLRDGRTLIDAVSSWWCKSLGHGHPALKAALHNQANQFEHVMLANLTHEPIIELSTRLSQLTNTLKKVSYASDGSCAVEMALKMSVHARLLLGQTHKTQFMALTNAYHGETLATLSVSDLGLYAKPYQSLLLDVPFIKNIPYVSGEEDPLWHDCSSEWPTIERQLEQQAETLSAIIVEPIVQGAGGMLIYSADFLRRLRLWTQKNDVHLIADEIMTGLGRTGKMLACEHAGIEPDFLCLSKSLTSGWLPLSAMLTRNDIYDLFYDDYDTGKAFMHSHTYTGNPLAASVANAFLTVLQEEHLIEKTAGLQSKMLSHMQSIAYETGLLHNIRGVGAVIAADIVEANVKCSNKNRLGYQVFQRAVEVGALLRPLGNTIYWLPPFVINDKTLSDLAQITQQALVDVLI